jgi:hypothetical protein
MDQNRKAIRAFVICSERELHRKNNIALLHQLLPGLMQIEAIYPRYTKIPFLSGLIQKSRERTGRALNEGEIGILLSNRQAWQEICSIAEDDKEPFLILESDSCINNPSLLIEKGVTIAGDYDLFFFGGWMGHIKLKRSTVRRITDRFRVGEPYIKTICSGYGYSVNRKAARYLLQRTSSVGYPVDEFKRYMEPGMLKVGAVLPELISELPGSSSTIGHDGLPPWLHTIKIRLLDIRNGVIAYCS